MYKLIKSSFITKQLNIKTNNLPPGNFELKPQITRKTGKLGDKKFFTSLVLEVKSSEEFPFPVDIFVDFRGVFEFENIEDEKNITEFLKLQAVHIMYPYLRSIVTNLTTTAMVPPIVLPIVDASRLFKKDNEKTFIN